MKEFHVSDDNFKVTITEEEQANIASSGGYVLKGDYQYLNCNTFMRIADVQAPSTEETPRSPPVITVDT